jgi:hypothetical protein
VGLRRFSGQLNIRDASLFRASPLHNTSMMVWVTPKGALMSLQDLQPYIAFLGTIIQLAVAVLLSLLFLLLRRYAERRKYFLTWAKSWLALSVAIAAIVVRYYILPSISTPVLDDWRPEVRLLYSVYQGAKLVFYALLAAGTALYVRGSVQGRMRQLAVLGIVVYTAISALYARDLNQFVMLQAPPAVMLTGWCGTMIYTMPRSRRTLGSLTLGGVFWYMAAVWSIYFVAFGLAGPLLPEYPGPAWFGFIVRFNPYFDLMAQVALGYAMVVLLMEDAKREVDNAHGELAVAHDQLRRASLYDSVTGLMNRRVPGRPGSRVGTRDIRRRDDAGRGQPENGKRSARTCGWRCAAPSSGRSAAGRAARLRQALPLGWRRIPARVS